MSAVRDDPTTVRPSARASGDRATVLARHWYDVVFSILTRCFRGCDVRNTSSLGWKVDPHGMNDFQCRYDQFVLVLVSLPRTNTADALRCIKALLRCCDAWTVCARKCTQDRTSVRYGSFDHSPHP